MTYRTYIKVVEKLKIIFSIVFLMTMLYLASQGDRRNYSPTYLEQKVIFEANLEKAIARDKENLNRNIPMARRLDDGIQGDIPIQDLMKGLKGFL